MKLVLVDDSFSARRALQAILEGLGFEVRSFGETSPALQALESEPADIVFCDYVLQNEDGVDMWRRMREVRSLKRIPFVLVSGLIDERVRHCCAEEGIDWVLAKPFTVDAVRQLLDAVQDSLRRAPRPVDEEELSPADDLRAQALAEIAREMLEDLVRLRDIAEVAVLDAAGTSVASTGEVPQLSEDLRSWAERCDSLLGPKAEPNAEAPKSMILETESRSYVAHQLDGCRVLASLKRFSALGPLRFYVERASVRLDALSHSTVSPCLERVS